MIYLMRHGETAFNAEGRYQGRIDTPLTDLGRDQAAAVAAALAERIGAAPLRIFASPLGRARETARIVADRVAQAATITVLDGLAELSLGRWEGLTRAEIEAGWPRHRKRGPRGSWFFDAPGGETLEDFSARLGAAMDAVGAAPGLRLVVTHRNAGRIVIGRHAGLDAAAMLTLPVPQGTLYALHPCGRAARVYSLDGTPPGPI
ncbi:histidine phosphatase family protein [Acidimangrovimonas sediminis]|uniref:histidine phosphatase family protein n=1 Tax=Acidimangrovimonas sediminis TaxID=2056283 RepID=UPI000C8026E3|nr:histidine phosphatase family protein [Acidimangrovimonas sediminis]